MNWYEATNEHALSNAANTVVGRLQRIDTVSAHRWAEYVVRIRGGQNPTTQNDFDNNTTHPLSAAQQTAISDLMWGNFEFKDFNWPAKLSGRRQLHREQPLEGQGAAGDLQSHPELDHQVDDRPAAGLLLQRRQGTPGLDRLPQAAMAGPHGAGFPERADPV